MFSSVTLIKPGAKIRKIFNISSVLNKKVLILFNTMNKMNKNSTSYWYLKLECTVESCRTTELSAKK